MSRDTCIIAKRAYRKGPPWHFMALARVGLHGSWLRVVIAPWGVAREQWLIQAEASTSDNVTRHPLTGAFANPLHESAFRAQLFRSAYVCHALLMTLSLAVYIWVALIAPQNLRVFWATIALITTFFTIGRALLHHMKDTQRGQQVSSWAWTGFLVPASIAVIYVYVMDTDSACEHVQLTYFAPLTSFATALINGSHGLGFVHKLGLIGLLLVTDLVLVSVCGELAGDPLGAVLLTGLGYRHLSMSATGLPKVKSMLLQVPHSRAKELARRALRLLDAAAVANLLARELGQPELSKLYHSSLL